MDPNSSLTAHDNAEVRALAHLEQTTRLMRGRAASTDEAAIYLAEEGRFGRRLQAVLARLEAALDAANQGDVILIDASALGEKIKDGKNQKTVLRPEEEDKIIRTFNHKEAIEDFSVVVSYTQIAEKNHSLSAGQYFDVKIDYVDITPEEFQEQIKGYEERLAGLFGESRDLEGKISDVLKGLRL
jgi:type I restriction-modification system DNA methylase subunit